MTVTEKAAYLRGLFEGLDLEEKKDETKLFKAMLDVIDDLAMPVSDLEDELALVSEQLDAVDEDLDDLEQYVYEEDECDCDDEGVYEVDCPACGETVYFDEADIDNGFAACPACGEKLEFDLDDECGCGCDGCGDDAYKKHKNAPFKYRRRFKTRARFCAPADGRARLEKSGKMCYTFFMYVLEPEKRLRLSSARHLKGTPYV